MHKEFIEKYKQFIIKSCLLDKDTVINDNDIIINDAPTVDKLELPVFYSKTNKVYSFNIAILPEYEKLSDCITVSQRISKYHEVSSIEELDNINN